MRYDSLLACDLYWKSSNTELIYTYLLPLVRIVISKEFPVLDDAQNDEVLSDAACYLFEYVHKRKYEHTEANEGHFTGYFYTIIKRQMYWSLNEVQRFAYLPPDTNIPTPRLVHPRDVENHIYLEQLPGYVRSLVIKRFRFRESELAACMYVLDQVLTGERIVLAYIRRDLNISDPEFFVTYVLVILRSTIYKLKLTGHHYCFSDVFYTNFEYAT